MEETKVVLLRHLCNEEGALELPVIEIRCWLLVLGEIDIHEVVSELREVVVDVGEPLEERGGKVLAAARGGEPVVEDVVEDVEEVAGEGPGDAGVAQSSHLLDVDDDRHGVHPVDGDALDVVDRVERANPLDRGPRGRLLGRIEAVHRLVGSRSLLVCDGLDLGGVLLGDESRQVDLGGVGMDIARLGVLPVPIEDAGLGISGETKEERLLQAQLTLTQKIVKAGTKQEQLAGNLTARGLWTMPIDEWIEKTDSRLSLLA